MVSVRAKFANADIVQIHTKIKIERILSWGKDFDEEKLSEMINRKIRFEKIAIKDVKLRTFITEDSSRNEMVQHVYDITYGTVRKNEDTLVIIDDSIVRGTTLKESIVRMLSRLSPKKIIIVSSAPQIRYPDCYGIDMAVMSKFVAFEAAIALLKQQGKEAFIKDLYERTKKEVEKPKEEQVNLVKEIYASFSAEQISDKIAELIKPKGLNAELVLIYQKLDGLHSACPDNLGDWYFTGNFPTPGGNQVVNKAFVNFMKGVEVRAY